MKGSLNLGKVSGIKIKVHWTFLFIIIWVAFIEINQGGNLQSVLFNIALILVVFLCVVLHELGHALTAQHYGVKTKKITLLPIGGIASLEKIPEEPKQELLVALAGPLVNVIIALILYFVVPVQQFLADNITNIIENLNALTLSNFLFYLFTVNVLLVIFNLIPAFPMDGGRVLRALLAMNLGRVKATQIAASIGQSIAIVFLLLGMLFNPFLILIALFVFVGAYGENKMVQQIELLKGHTVEEAMLTNITLLKPEETMARVKDLILSSTEKDFIVGQNGKPLGILMNADIIKNSNKPNQLVGNVMKTSFKELGINDKLKNVLSLAELHKGYFFPVLDANKKLVGAIDLTNINEFILFQSKLEY
ncbi:MAG: site-2 protease family protein [Maribacter sp.]|nr:site-2 protease family protein [Maribacter sp.]MBT8315285.1 site-2 protease family protein [Maribacter sp.]